MGNPNKKNIFHWVTFFKIKNKGAKLDNYPFILTKKTQNTMKNLALALSLAFTMVFAASCDKQGGESGGADTTKTVDTVTVAPMVVDSNAMKLDSLKADSAAKASKTVK